MGILRFLLEMYFAATLGVAGFAKLDHPQLFLHTLQRLRILPDQSTVAISRLFPWFEIILAFSLLLIMRPYEFIIALIVLVLFISFFIFNIARSIGNSPPKDCGCYGMALRRQGVQTDRITLFIQLILAGLLVSLSLWVVPLPAFYYFGSALLFVGIGGWISWRIWQKHRYFTQVNQSVSITDSQI